MADRPRVRGDQVDETARADDGRLGAELGADGISFFDEDEAWDVVAQIPNNSAAALILLEHHWAVPLRDAVYRAGGFRIDDGWISPYDLVAIGLMAAEESKELEAVQPEPAAG